MKTYYTEHPLPLLHVMDADILYSIPFYPISWKNKILAMTQYAPHDWKILTH